MRLHNRQIKASFWTDSDLLRWPREKRWFYEGLIQLADDSGCLEDDPFMFKLLLFPSPLDSDITVELLEKWRDELIQEEKIIPYQAGKKKCLFLKNFHKHQSIKNPEKPSVPLPPWIRWEAYESNQRSGKYVVSDDVLTDFLRSSYGVLTTNASVSYGFLPIELKEKEKRRENKLNNYTLAHATNVACAEEQPKETEAAETAVEQMLFAETVQDFDGDVEAETVTVTSNETSKRTSPRPPFNSKRQEEWFDAFWREYPRKKSKGQAERAWMKLRVDEVLFQAIMDGLSRAKESYDWQKEGGKYIPYPATWLNAKGWEDDYRPAAASSARPRADPPVSRMRAYFEALDEFAREGGDGT